VVQCDLVATAGRLCRPARSQAPSLRVRRSGHRHLSSFPGAASVRCPLACSPWQRSALSAGEPNFARLVAFRDNGLENDRVIHFAGLALMTMLSLCLICRDNARTIRPCLESIRPWVDEMVVVDTGSTDETPQIALELGARLFHFAWCDDFAAARNESLRHARGQWIFWMDSDDSISEDNGRNLRQLAYRRHGPRTLGFVMQVWCPGEERSADLTVVDHVKMFRNHPEIRFEFRLHEQVLPSIKRLGGDVEWTDISVLHSGADRTLEGRRRKYERDVRILGEELEARPEHPFVLFNLGMTHGDMDDHERAVEYLERCVAVSHQSDSHLRKAYALLVSSLERCRRVVEVSDACHRGLEAFPDDPELLFRSGVVAHSLGQLQDAESAYLKAIRPRSRARFSSIDPGIASYKARHNLGLVYEAMGRADLAEVQWRNSTVNHSQFALSRRVMIERMIQQRRRETAQVEIEGMQSDGSLRCDGLILEARLEESAGNIENAKRWLEVAVKESPDREEPLQALCRLLFDHEASPEAEIAIEELLRRTPGDATAYHNLGVVLVRQGKQDRAIQAFQKSLELRPDAAMTQASLDAALSTRE